MIIESGLARSLFVLISPKSSQSDKECIAGGWSQAKFAHDSISIQPRQADVAKDCIWFPFKRITNTIGARVGHSHFVPEEIEKHGERLCCVRIVFDNQNPSVWRNWYRHRRPCGQRFRFLSSSWSNHRRRDWVEVGSGAVAETSVQGICPNAVSSSVCRTISVRFPDRSEDSILLHHSFGRTRVEDDVYGLVCVIENHFASPLASLLVCEQ